MARLEHLNPASAPAPAGMYSQLSISAENVRVATFSGQIAATSTGTEMPASPGDQTRVVFAAIGALLASRGATPADLIKLLAFVVGRDSLAEFNVVRPGVLRVVSPRCLPGEHGSLQRQNHPAPTQPGRQPRRQPGPARLPRGTPAPPPTHLRLHGAGASLMEDEKRDHPG